MYIRMYGMSFNKSYQCFVSKYFFFLHDEQSKASTLSLNTLELISLGMLQAVALSSGLA